MLHSLELQFKGKCPNCGIIGHMDNGACGYFYHFVEGLRNVRDMIEQVRIGKCANDISCKTL
jgi:hypothetical protein